MTTRSEIESRFSTKRIDTAVKTLQSTKLGAVLVEFGLMKEVYIELDNSMETAGYFSENLMGAPTIKLNANLNDYGLAIALAHELCHVEQIMVAPYPFTFSNPLDAIKLTRIYEAVASTFSTGVAYELFQKTGDVGYLESLSDWEEGDIKDAFLVSASDSQPIISDTSPFIAGFDQWFKRPQRVEHYDTAAIQAFTDFKDNTLLHVLFNKSVKPLTFDMLKDVGHLLAHTNYLKEINMKSPLLESSLYAGNISISALHQADELFCSYG